MPSLLDALTRPAPIAQAAAKAIAALGEAALPDVRIRLKTADAALQLRLSEVLAHIASKKGLSALLEGFYNQDLESVLKNAVLVRHEVRGLDRKA